MRKYTVHYEHQINSSNPASIMNNNNHNRLYMNIWK